VDRADDLQAILLWHVDVREHQVGALQRPERFARADHRDGEARALELLPEPEPGARIIVDQ
jgi:hypothetical protein